MRLPNGYGSVYKLKGNRRRPWIARVTVGWTDGGKQLYKIVGYYKTKAEGLKALAEYHKDPGIASDVTLAELYEHWKETTAYTKLARKTQKGYDDAWNHLSVIGRMPIKEIRKSQLQAVVDDLVRRGIGYATCHKVKVLAGILFKHAMADNVVTQNYAQHVVLPEKPDTKKRTFTDLEIRSITKLAESGDIWAGTVLILIYTGMRISELTSLTKFQIDWERQLIIGGIKTDAGKNRVVPISPKIRRYMEYWYNLPGECMIQRDGAPVSSDYYRKHLYYPVLDKADVRRLTPHEARHTFGTLLEQAGVSPKYIQELMGHADYTTTANIYIHPDLEELRKAVASI